MERNFGGNGRAWLCALFLVVMGCQRGGEQPPAPEPQPPPVVTEPAARLLLQPDAVLLQGQGASQSLVLRAFDAKGKPVDASPLDLELTSSNPEEISITWAAPDRLVVTALKPVGSSLLVVRGKGAEAPLSNPVTALAVELKPGVQLVNDDRVVFPPSESLMDAAGAGLLPDISAPDSDGSVRIGSFSDEEVYALFEADRVRTAAVLRGASPSAGTLLLGGQGAPVAGRVVRSETRDGFSLVQLEHEALPSFFQELRVHFDSNAFQMVGIQARAKRHLEQQIQQAANEPSPLLDCSMGGNNHDLADLAPWHSLQMDARLEVNADVEKGHQKFVRVKAGLQFNARIGVRIKLEPGYDPDFECLILEEIEFGPFIPPGPLAALVSFKAQFQPHIKGEANIESTLLGELRLGADISGSMAIGLQWSEADGTRLITEGGKVNFTEVIEAEGDLVQVPSKLLSTRVDASAGPGITGTLLAVPTFLESGARYFRWVPSLGKKLSEWSETTRLDILRTQVSALYGARWHGDAYALSAMSDDGGLDFKPKLEFTPLPGLSKFLDKIFDVDNGSVLDLSLEPMTFWERTALRRQNRQGQTKIDLSSGSDTGGSDDECPSVKVKNGDTVSVSVSLAPVEDPAQGLRLYRGTSEPTLFQDMQGAGSNWNGLVELPSNFCDTTGYETFHVVGDNKVKHIHMSSYLGSFTARCEEDDDDGGKCGPPPPKKATRFRPSHAPGRSLPPGNLGWHWGADWCFGCNSAPLLNTRNGADTWGDPHLTTFDGMSWTAYALGEFWLLRELPLPGGNGEPRGIQVQARHQRLPGFAGWASFNTAVAVRAGDYIFEVRMPRAEDGRILLDRRHDLELLINGQRTTLPYQAYVLDENLSFRVTEGNRLEIAYKDPTVTGPVANPDEHYTRVRIGTRGEKGLLRTGGDPSEPVLSIDVSIETNGTYRGLFGTPDGLSNNDFTTWDGRVQTAPTSVFLNSFRVNDTTESFFTYLPGEGPATFRVPQTSTLPTPSELGPFVERVQALFSNTCGMTPEAISALEEVFLEQLAYELASGRTEKNLVASGLCDDSRVKPPVSVVFFGLAGRVTLTGRPDIGIGGARVRIAVREASRVVCEATTREDGRYDCNDYLPVQDLPLNTALTLDYTVSGRGPSRSASIIVPAPAPDSLITYTQDFEAAVSAVLEVRGLVRDPQGVPVSGARVRIESPFLAEVESDSHGAFQRYISLPDGVRGGTLLVRAAARDRRTSGLASVDFSLPGPGIHTVELEVGLQPEPGGLSPLENTPRVGVLGRLTNALIQEVYGVSDPILGAKVRVRLKGTTEDLCSKTITQWEGRWSCEFAVPKERPQGPLELEVLTDGLPSARRELLIAESELPAAGQRVTRSVDVQASPTTLVYQGRVMNLGNVEIIFDPLGNVERKVTTASDGTYRAFLSLPFETTFSGPVGATARMKGAGDVGVLELRTTEAVRASGGGLTMIQRDFVFTRGTAVLAGRVLNALAGDAPVPGAQVTVKASARTLCEVVTDGEGRYTCNVSNEGGGTLQLSYSVGFRGQGVFTEFDGQPAVLDLSTIAPATVQPVLPTRDLRVSPTTVKVTGMVRDSAGRPVAGAVVGAAVGTFQVPTVLSAEDGGFKLILPLREGELEGWVRLSAHLPLPGGALRAEDAVPFAFSVPHTRADLPITLTLNGALPPDSEGNMANLAFSGVVTNGLASGVPIEGARVRVRLGADGSLLCEATANRQGAYKCQAMLAPAPASPALFEYSLFLGSAPIAEVTRWSHGFTRSATIQTQLVQNLVARPTTLELRGRVTKDGTTPWVGAEVTFAGLGLGTVVTDEQGDYVLVAALPVDRTHLEGALTVVANGLSESRTISTALTAGGVTRRTEDFVVSSRALRLTGRVDNLLAPGTHVRDGVVELLRDGSRVCAASLRWLPGEGLHGFTCPEDLVLREAAPITLTWRARNVTGQRTGSAMVRLEDLPPAGSRRVHTLVLGLDATTLWVNGTVRNRDGQPVGGVAVTAAASGGQAQATTAPDGTYSLALVLPDIPAMSENGQPAAWLSVVAALGADAATVGGIVVAPLGQLTLVVRDVSFADATRLEFSGQVLNANASRGILPRARVRILREGAAPENGLLCDVQAEASGAFSCPRTTLGELLTSLTVRFQVTLLGTPVGPDIVQTFAVTPGSGESNVLYQELAVLPTTVRVTGTLRDSGGTPLPGASVQLRTEQLEGLSVTSDSSGRYSAVMALPTGTPGFTGTLTARLNGNEARAPVALAPLAQGTANGVQVDLTMSERRVLFAGRIRNTLAPLSPLPGARVVLRLGGVPFCETWTNNSSGNANNYACNFDDLLVRGDRTPFEVTWEVTGPFGSASGTRRVLAEELPEAGQQVVLALDGDLNATTLEVSGMVRVDGVPQQGARVRVIPTQAQDVEEAEGLTGNDGRFVLRVAYPVDTMVYTVIVQATYDVHGTSNTRTGVLAPSALTAVTQDIDLVSPTGGVKAWSQLLHPDSSWMSWTLRHYAAPVQEDAVIVPKPGVLEALRVSDGTTKWTASLAVTSSGEHDVSCAPLVDEAGTVYAGDTDGFLHAFTATGERLWFAPGSLESGAIDGLSLGDGILFATQREQVRAYSTADGSLLWSTEELRFPEKLITAPGGTLLVWIAPSDSGGGKVVALRQATGESRWRLGAAWGYGNAYGIPAITPDGYVVVMNEEDLVKVDLNGQEVWRVSLGGATSMPPSIAPDGSAFVTLSTELVKVSASGVEEARVTVADDPAHEYLGAPTLGADGSIYIGAGSYSSQASILYALRPNLERRWSYRRYSNVGSTFNVSTVSAGRVVVVGNAQVLAVEAGSVGGMAVGGWARLYGDAANTSRALVAASYREVVIRGVVSNGNKGVRPSFPLEGFELELRQGSGGRLLGSSESAEDGSYRFSLAMPGEEATQLRVSVRGMGYTAESVVEIDAGIPPGGVVEEVLDLALPITTLEVTGVVRSVGERIEGASVQLHSENYDSLPFEGRGTSDAIGAYAVYALYAAGGALVDDFTLEVRHAYRGRGSSEGSVTLSEAALTSVQLDVEIVNQALSWLRPLPSGCESYWGERIVVGGGNAYVPAYCTSPDGQPFGTLVQVSVDGQTLRLPTRDGQQYVGELVGAVMGPDGRIYAGGYGALRVLTPELQWLGELSLGSLDTQVLPPAVVTRSEGEVRMAIPIRNSGTAEPWSMRGFDFLPETTGFIPLWESPVPGEQSETAKAVALAGSTGETAYVSLPGQIHAIAMAPEASPRLRFTQPSPSATMDVPAMALWPGPLGDQVRFTTFFAPHVGSFDASGEVTAGWPYAAQVHPNVLAVAPNGVTYFVTWDSRLQAVSPEGTLRWSIMLPTEGWSVIGLSADAMGRVYAATSIHVFAVDETETGPKLAWTYFVDEEDSISAGPEVIPGGVLILVGSEVRAISR